MADVALGKYVESKISEVKWEPIRVVSDKIYDIKVYGRVDNARWLSQLEVRLIPVEYDYFITRYGMRQEDYPLVFLPEKTRSVRFEPRGVEKEQFEVEFKDLVGGREYLIEVEAKDFAGNSKEKKVKMPYVRGNMRILEGSCMRGE